MSDVIQAVLIAFSIFGLGIIVGGGCKERTLRQEAVEAGAAAWCVVDTAGTVEFRWKAEICKGENNE